MKSGKEPGRIADRRCNPMDTDSEKTAKWREKRSEAGAAGPRRAGRWQTEPESPGSARLNLSKTAFARLGPPSPTLIFFAKRSLEPVLGG